MNPNHPVTQAMDSNWHKVAALLMRRLGVTHAEFTAADIDRLEGQNIAIRFTRDQLQVFIVKSEAEALEFARKEGGLAV